MKSTGNWARNWNSTIGTSGISTTRKHRRELHAKTSLGFWKQTDHLISVRRPHLLRVNEKKKTSQIVNFTVSADHRVKIKENVKRDKYLELARELKKLLNMKVRVKTIIVGTLELISKLIWFGIWKSWKSESEPRPSKVLHCWGQQEYWEEFWRTEETCFIKTPVIDYQLTRLWKSRIE